MPITNHDLTELTNRQLDAWHALRAANTRLDSPYFHPGFAAAVHAAGVPVRVAVATDAAGEIQALLPTHQDGGELRPVGWPGADFQGPIRAPGSRFAPLDLLSGGVRGYAFDHLLVDDEDGTGAEFTPWIESRRPSPYLDVTGGLDGYLGRASSSGKSNIGQARRHTAKTEKAYGTVRFAVDVVDDAALDQLIELKRGQYAATGAADYFADPRRVHLLRSLLRTRDPEFAGILSTLHAGPRLVAAHFGLRSGGVLHWWFPVYDPEFAKLAPGWMLLRELVAAAPGLGVTRIDLGRGEDEYKRRAKTGEMSVAQGLVTRSSARRALRRLHGTVVGAAKSSPLGPGLRRAVRAMRGGGSRSLGEGGSPDTRRERELP
ncbi:CelD/BcsL family acetyltransferase involved in cellulose biosynthesis [Hamadaea flava]|uniref:GNAT family N-acetyltransferase n=1 Tax=Hamadaea flava TaxID=1742688 RepID=A0ABV8LKE3_9ACTN|nr:GNAT family N-acetyltransferase [Hamadaea flava]MCP2325073.1 CelD/BcsL family acetyltransferase involved in cellulose biosynthesis [Hamadaea flava]